MIRVLLGLRYESLTFLMMQGGIGPAGLSAEDLHVLDLTQQRPRWHRLDFDDVLCSFLDVVIRYASYDYFPIE